MSENRPNDTNNVLDITIRRKPRDDFHSCKVMYILRGIHTHARVSTDTLTQPSGEVTEIETLDIFCDRMKNVGLTDMPLITKLYSITNGIVSGQDGETKVAELSRRLSTPKAVILSRDVYAVIATLLASLEQVSDKLTVNSDSSSDTDDNDVVTSQFQSIRDKHMDLQSIVCTIIARKMSVDSINQMLTPLLNSNKSVSIYTKMLQPTVDITSTNGKDIYTITESSADRLLNFMECPGAYHTSGTMYDLAVLSNITDETDDKVWTRSTATQFRVKGTTHQSAGHVTLAFNISSSSATDREIILRLFNASAIYYRQDETSKYDLVPFVVSKKGLMGGCVVIRLFTSGIATWARYCSQVEMMGMLSSVVNTLTEHREAFHSPGLCVNLPSNLYESLKYYMSEGISKRKIYSFSQIHSQYSRESNSQGSASLDHSSFTKCLESLKLISNDVTSQGFPSIEEAQETMTYVFMLLDLFDIFKTLKEYSSQSYETKESITATLKEWVSYRNGVKNYFKVRSNEIYTEVCDGTSELLNVVDLMVKFRELQEYTRVHR